MSAGRGRISNAKPGWYVLWCGGVCAGNPHATKKAAKAWLARHLQSAADAKAPMYGSYTIVKHTPATREGSEGEG